MLHFFYLFSFCILYRVGRSVLRNVVLFVLLAFLHFGIVCVFARLPYFLQWFCALHQCFFGPNYVFLPLVDVLQILVGLPSSSSVFFCRCTFRFVALEAFGHCSFVFRFLFVCADGLLLFFGTNFVSPFFCNLLSWLTYLCVRVLLIHFASLVVFLLFRCLNT